MTFRQARLARFLSLPAHGPTGEDRFAVAAKSSRWSLCDGASESWDAAAWARVLSASFARWGTQADTTARARSVYSKIETRATDWISGQARNRGSWSTALVLQVSGGGTRAEAWAVGDTELFVLDGTSLVRAFPIEEPSGFGPTPALFYSGDAPEPAIRHERFLLAALSRPSLVMATDALAARILAASVTERSRLFSFFLRCSPAEFAAWGSSEIAARSIAHDDLTLAWIR